MSERGESSASSPSMDESPPSSSSSSPQVQEEVEEGERDQIQQHPFSHHEVERHHTDTTYRENFTTFNDTTSAIHDDDSWSCIIVVLTFWFFVSMTLVLGVYGSVNLRLGPNSSILVQPNALFVQSLKVEQLDDTKPGPLLYGFYKPPALDVVTSWSKTYNASVSADYHMEWTYYLNQGSQINISYSVNTPESSIFLVIAEGNEGFTQWLEDPTYPNTTLSWNVIHGAGTILQDIYQSADYYVAVGNLNTEEIEVQLSITATAYLYNTTESYYKCTFSSGECSLDILFPSGNAAVLATPSPGQGTPSDEWYVRISYGPRWIAYILGIGGLSTLMLAAFNYLNMFRWTREGRNRGRNEQVGPERAPLLSHKEDDSSSFCSSYDSTSQDEKDIEEFLALEGIERKQKDGENGNNTRRLCAICFDAPRDCFFLPCGHCVSCFECGTRIMEAAGTCPMCRRNMKKVRKIFTV